MTDEKDLNLFGLEGLLAEIAEESFSVNAGQITQGKIEFGFTVWGGESRNFFAMEDGGRTQAAAQAAHAEAKKYAAERSLEEWRVKRALRVTQYAGTNLNELPWDFNEDSVRIVTHYQVKDRNWEENYSWRVMIESMQDPDVGFSSDMLGQDVWLQVRSRLHPDYNKDDPDPDFNDREIYREKWDSETGTGTGEFKPIYHNYLEKIFFEKDRIVSYMKDLGLEVVEGAGGSTASKSSGLRSTTPDGWTGSQKEWEESYDYIVEQIKGGKGPKAKVVGTVADEWGTIAAVTKELVGEIYDEVFANEPPF